MRSKRSSSRHDDLFRERLDAMINMRYSLVRLAAVINWQRFDDEFGTLYSPIGRPGVATRLMVCLHYIKHMYNLSGEIIVERQLENPYWRYFCGLEYFSHELPIDPSSMTRWWQRIGPEAMQKILETTVETALGTKTIKPSSLERVTVDTTIQPKAFAHPTDGRLYLKALQLGAHINPDFSTSELENTNLFNDRGSGSLG